MIEYAQTHAAASANQVGNEPHADQLARVAIPRLRMLASLFAVMLALLLAIDYLLRVGVLEIPVTPWSDGGAVSVALVCALGLIGATYSKRLPPRRVLDLGIAYQIFGAFCIAFLEESQPPGRGVSLTCIWILTFPLVPDSPGRTALAAYGAAAMGPLALLARIAGGTRMWPNDAGQAMKLATTFVAAVIAVYIAKVIYGLGREVADARKLGAYALVDKLGQGGMGEVWRAEHHALIRPAAIKLMRRELVARMAHGDAARMTLRFQREVQATAQLTSPHTVAVYDFGASGDGSLYYVMELLSGLDAEKLVTAFGPQPAERVVHLIRQATKSLAEAHRRGLVHRDIKPANLYICAIGADLDFVKILDFGLVHDLVDDHRLTQDGLITGTPAYIAPESAAGRRADARTDIYALGCVAYWLLTGSTVFEATSAPAMLAAHLRDQPVPPSHRTELPVPAALDAIVLACLAKDPAGRPQSADEVERMLSEIALPPWTPPRAEAWWHSHMPDVLHRARSICRDSAELEPRRRPAPVAPAPPVRAWS